MVIAKMENLRTPFAMFHLTLLHLLRFSSPSFSRSLSLSPLLFLYFISFSVISHEPGIVGISELGDGLRRLSLAFFEDSDPGIVGLSVSDRNLSYSITLLSLSLPQLSLAFFEDSDPGIVGLSVSDRNLSYSITLLSLSLPRLSLAFFEDSDPGIVGLSVSDRNLSYSITLLSLSLPQLSLSFFEDSDPGIVGLSVSDRNLSYSITLLPYLYLNFLLLPLRIPTLVSLVFPYQIGIFHIL